ncbi:MAG: ethanolamine ammonia-lyase light chain EutC, partial [Acidobacteria bacterium]|nr:ethanolamine ammonia-lyase light chain EutC [Acidobacteriota bacterium]
MAIDLRSFTAARVGLQRRGYSLSTSELLRFDLDHARARDAVHLELDASSLGFDHTLVR